jgi:hypothetical protein
VRVGGNGVHVLKREQSNNQLRGIKYKLRFVHLSHWSQESFWLIHTTHAVHLSSTPIPPLPRTL